MSSDDLGSDPKFTRVVAAANELRLALDASMPPGRRLAVCHTKLEECFLWYMSEMLAKELQLGGARAPKASP